MTEQNNLHLANQHLPLATLGLVWHNPVMIRETRIQFSQCFRAILVIMLILTAAALHAQVAPAPLNHIGQVRALPLSEGTNPLPVKVRAMVTYADPGWKMMFVQEGADAVFVGRNAPSDDPSWALLKPGTMVDLEGFVSQGVVCCNIRETNLVITGQGPLPTPLKLGSDESMAATNDAVWSSASGFITGIDSADNKSILSLALGPDKRVKVFVLNSYPAAWEGMKGDVIEVNGVFGLDLDAQKKPTGVTALWVGTSSQIRKVRRIPLVPIGNLAEMKGKPLPNGLIQVRGNILNQRPGEFLFMRDDSGTLRVNFKGATSYGTGSPIDAYGYAAYENDTPVLNDVILLKPNAIPSMEAAATVTTIRPVAANPNLAELTEVAQVRNLSATEASRGYPVRVTGVVTYNDTNSAIQFIQDGSGGIFVDLRNKKFDTFPTAGQNVEVRGFSDPGDFAPVIEAEEVRILAPTPLPTPKTRTPQALMTGSEDSQWVSLKGIVHSQSIEKDLTVLSISTGDALISVLVPNAATQGAPLNYVDADVKVQGVCATLFDSQRKLLGIRLYVPNWNSIIMEEAAPEDAFALPLRPISELLQFHAPSSDVHRSKVRGVVLLRRADGACFIQDATGGILIQPRKGSAKVKKGQTVELVGFPSLLNRLPVLQECLIRPVTGRSTLEPIKLSPEQPLKEGFHGTLVSMEGRVLRHSTSTTEESLTLQFGPWITDAVLEKEQPEDQMARILPGSVVNLKGVYVARMDDNRQVQSFQVLVGSPDNILILSRPPLLTAKHLFWAVGGLAVVLLLALTWVSLLRTQVHQRTCELSAEIEEHKRTEKTLEEEILRRKRVEEEVEKTHKALLAASREAGMAEVATSVLHNVGNVLNSVNVSANLLSDKVNQSKVGTIRRLTELINGHKSDLGAFLTLDPKGRLLPDYLGQLADHLDKEKTSILLELGSLTKNVDHIKEIVAMQQNYAKVMGVTEVVAPKELVEDAVRLNLAALERHGIKLQREYDENLPTIVVEKHKALQILANLISNAKNACGDSQRPDKLITLRTAKAADRIDISIIDNGVGIPKENLTIIFNHGFTTRKGGHGFGLHNGALVAKEIGGSLRVQSNGPGQGAIFTLQLPMQMVKPRPKSE